MKVKGIIASAFVFAIIALAIGFSSCNRMAPMVPDTEMTPTMDVGIPIGVVVSLTGKDAEPYGLPMQRGFEIAREEINMLSDANITFITEDDQSSEEGAIAAVQRLVDQGVPVILGIAISDYLEDAFPIAQENGVVAFSSVSSAAGLSSIGDYVFRTGLATNIMIPSGVMATHAQLGYEKAALIYDAEDTYSKSSNDEVRKALEASGVEILTEETFQTGDTDFSMQLTNIMEMEPDALFISALSVEMTQIIIQAGAMGIPDAVRLIVPDLTPKEIQDAGGAAEGAIAFSGWTSLSNIPGNQAFLQSYQAKYGIEAEPWAAQSYATLNILADAIAKAQSIDSAAIRDALAQTMDFPTILGDFSFDPNGEALYDAVVLTVMDGKLQLFEAAMPQMMDEMTTTSQEIPIGVALALTGELAEPYGLPMQRGLELARKEINMRSDANITFITEDAQSTVEGGVAAVQKLVDQGVPAIVGIGISTHLEQAFPIAQENGVIAFSPISSAAGLGSLGDYIFRTGLTTSVLNPNGVMVTHEKLGYEKVATIYDAADTYSTSSNEENRKGLEASGVEILTEETFQTGDTDFSVQLTNIMEMEPDALFIAALSSEMTQIIIQAREIGIPESVHLIVPDLTPKEIQDAGGAAEGAIAFSGWTPLSNMPGNQAFIQHYQAEYGIEAEPWAAQAYATLYILANAIAKAQAADSAAIRDALAQTMSLPTILGNFSFDPNGEAMYDPIVLIVKDGELQAFE